MEDDIDPLDVIRDLESPEDLSAACQILHALLTEYRNMLREGRFIKERDSLFLGEYSCLAWKQKSWEPELPNDGKDALSQ
ncbi:MAG TPA: hypothetical protein VHR66_29910 [Gemmataceae bacterium]|jgi:type IV secretory pathway TraG/TraD family ATPase VirD4|nr:hypothetical protein [Gemmataceae bacterium]